MDGLSVLSGEAASISDNGYVIHAWGEYTIKGFRKDNSSVGAFKFVERANSYAEGKGEGSNVGVIGIAVYPEYVAPHYIYNTGYSKGVGTLRGTLYSHGTTWGNKITDNVTVTTFKRDSNAPSVVESFFYNSREKLQEFGVKLIHEALVSAPSAFPKGFVTPPAGWN